MAANGKRKFSENVHVEPNYDPDAISRYYQFSSGIGSKPNSDTHSLIHNAKQHLSALGWSFFKIPKGPNNYKELRYRSPSGKVYISLRTACKAFLTINPPDDDDDDDDPVKKDTSIVYFNDGFLKYIPSFDGIEEKKIDRLSELKKFPPQEIIIGSVSKERGRKRSRESTNILRRRGRFIISCHCDLSKFVTKVAINECCCGRDPNNLVHNLMMMLGIISCHVIRGWEGRNRDDLFRFLERFVSQSITTVTFYLVLRLLNQ